MVYVKHGEGSSLWETNEITEFLLSLCIAETPPALCKKTWDEPEKQILWRLSVVCLTHAQDGCWLLEGHKQSMCASYNPVVLLFTVRNWGLGWKNTDLPFSLGQSPCRRCSEVFWLILLCCTLGITALSKNGLSQAKINWKSQECDSVMKSCIKITIKGTASTCCQEW